MTQRRPLIVQQEKLLGSAVSNYLDRIVDGCGLRQRVITQPRPTAVIPELNSLCDVQQLPLDVIGYLLGVSPMRRREFVTLLGGAVAASSRAAQAGPRDRLPTIGFLGASTQSAWSNWVAAFVQRLRQLGWMEGRTIAIEYRWADGHPERYAEIAAEFAQLKVDVIVTVGSATLAAMSRGCRSSRLILLGNASSCCVRFFPAFANWQSWLTLAMPPR
jgi:hypothetical protein